MTVSFGSTSQLGILKYIVYYGTSSSSMTNTKEVTTTSTSTSTTITGLTNGQIYYFKVVAYDTVSQPSTASDTISKTINVYRYYTSITSTKYYTSVKSSSSTSWTSYWKETSKSTSTTNLTTRYDSGRTTVTASGTNGLWVYTSFSTIEGTFLDIDYYSTTFMGTSDKSGSSCSKVIIEETGVGTWKTASLKLSKTATSVVNSTYRTTSGGKTGYTIKSILTDIKSAYSIATRTISSSLINSSTLYHKYISDGNYNSIGESKSQTFALYLDITGYDTQYKTRTTITMNTMYYIRSYNCTYYSLKSIYTKSSSIIVNKTTYTTSTEYYSTIYSDKNNSVNGRAYYTTSYKVE